MSLFGSILGGGTEKKAVQFSDRWLDAFSPLSKAGTSVGVDSALRCSTALHATRVLSQGIAQPAFRLYTRSKSDPRARAVVTDHPLARVLDRPNDWQTSFEFRETIMLHAILTGNGVAFINRGVRKNGPVRELIPLMPGSYSIEQLDDYTVKYRVSFIDGRYAYLDRSDVLHLRGMSWNSYRGLETLALAREAIGLALAAEETHSRLHSNGARIGGFLTTPADVDLDEDTIKRIKEEWNASYAGLSNVMKTALLQGGLKFEPLSMKGVDAEHLETRKFQIEEVCREFGIFPVMVGHSDKSSTFASVSAFLQAHVNVSLVPWAERFEQACWRDLLTDQERAQGYEFDIDLMSLLRGDPEARRAFYQTCVSLGIITRNDARVMEGFNPLSGLDDPLTPANALGASVDLSLRPASDPTKKAFAAFLEHKIGRVISAANERRLTDALAMIADVLEQVRQEEEVSE